MCIFALHDFLLNMRQENWTISALWLHFAAEGMDESAGGRS